MKVLLKQTERGSDFQNLVQFVGLPGFEPGKAGPESAVLPLHHSPMLKCDAKVLLFFVKKIFSPFFLLKK